MSAEQNIPAQPAPKPSAGQATPARKRWQPKPPTQSNISIWIVAVVAVLLSLGLLTGLHYIFRVRETPVVLAAEFNDMSNYFSIQAPRKWSIDDRAQENSVFIQGPKEPRFRPLIWINPSIPAPGRLPKFVAEQKARLLIEEPSVKFTFEDTDSIDGCEAVRLEYECDYAEVAGAEPFKLKTVQFILKDPTYYMFYKITCSARADTFDQHKAAFEASARTFHRLPLPKTQPRYLPN